MKKVASDRWPVVSKILDSLVTAGGEYFADAGDGIALGGAKSEEFKAVAKALAIADNAANLQGIRTEGERNFE